MTSTTLTFLGFFALFFVTLWVAASRLFCMPWRMYFATGNNVALFASYILSSGMLGFCGLFALRGVRLHLAGDHLVFAPHVPSLSFFAAIGITFAALVGCHMLTPRRVV